MAKGRPILARFDLANYKWDNFSNYFDENKKGVLTAKIVNKRHRKRTKKDKKIVGHAMCIIGINKSKRYFKVKNSWGRDFSDDGYFRIKYDALKLEYMDVYFLLKFSIHFIKGHN